MRRDVFVAVAPHASPGTCTCLRTARNVGSRQSTAMGASNQQAMGATAMGPLRMSPLPHVVSFCRVSLYAYYTCFRAIHAHACLPTQQC